MICSESTRAFGHPSETNPTFGFEAVGAAGVEVCDIENGPARAMSDAIYEGLGVQPGRRNRGKRGCTVRRCTRGEVRREMGPCGSCGKSVGPAQATSDYTVDGVRRVCRGASLRRRCSCSVQLRNDCVKSGYPACTSIDKSLHHSDSIGIVSLLLFFLKRKVTNRGHGRTTSTNRINLNDRD